MKEDKADSMWAVVEDSCEMIARARRSAELMYDIPTEEFDKRLNEICAKAQEQFGNMGLMDLALNMMKDFVMRCPTGDLADLFEEVK